MNPLPAPPLPAEAAVLHTAPPLEEFAVSETIVTLPDEAGRPVSLRQWQADEASGLDPGWTVLLHHGLGGCTTWMKHLAAELLRFTPRVYGLDLPAYGPNASGVGHFTQPDELFEPCLQAVSALRQAHGPSVLPVGLSLGGLVWSHVAARFPQQIPALAVISPAYRGAQETFEPKLYLNIIAQYWRERLTGRAEPPIPLPYVEAPHLITRNGEHVGAMNHPEPRRVGALTATAYMTLMRMTLWDTPRLLSRIQQPVWMAVAGQDRICDRGAMLSAFRRFPGGKRLAWFPEGFHDLVFEPEMPAMARDLGTWLQTLAAYR